MQQQLVKPEQQEAARILLERRQARRSFASWCKLVVNELADGKKIAKHHQLIIDKLQEVTDSPISRYVILMMPPGSAKSTYTSKTFPAWFLGRKPKASILACSYSKDLAATFGRSCRNLAQSKENELGYTLRSDSKAADEWETSNGGVYFCAGVGAGIAGRRADLGLIDDFIGNQEDADSQLVRDKQWDWFWSDFYPRLKPNASIVIIANRRHEDDLIGRLIDPNANSPIHPTKWEVISLPFFAEDNDVLGRQPGERIWPEWFTEEQAMAVHKLPSRLKSGLYQQHPTPDEGDYFKTSWLVGYEPQDCPPVDELRIYAASDHAVSEKRGSNRTAFVFGGVDSAGVLWILSRGLLQLMGPEKQVGEMLDACWQMKPIVWWAEKGHISKSIGPFLRKRMMEEHVYTNIEEVTPVKDKGTRARSIQARMSMGMVRFPKFTQWWADAEWELLHFTGSGNDKHDDWIDAIAHLGMGLDRMTGGEKLTIEKEKLQVDFKPTFAWIKDANKRLQYEKDLVANS